jgi:hypothetical protein
MFNPRQIITALSKSANPNQMLSQIARTNPAVQQAMMMVNGKTPAQVKEMAEKMAAQCGINLDTFMREMGISPDQMKF